MADPIIMTGGMDPADAQHLDRETRKQEKLAAAYDVAKESALEQVHMLAEWLADEVQTAAYPTSHTVVGFALRPETRAAVPLAEVLQMTAPDCAPETRMAALDEIWRRHMAGMDGWIAEEAERIAE